MQNIAPNMNSIRSMKPLIFLATIAIASFWIDCSSAAALEGSLLRLDGSLNIRSTTLGNGTNEASIFEIGYAGAASYQSSMGLYGTLGLGETAANKIKIDKTSFDTNDSYFVRQFGFGYRIPRASGEGLYWGIGYNNTDMIARNSAPDHSFSLFWQKERAHRYGIIDVSYTNNKNYQLVSVAGKHLWFFGEDDPGIGVFWSLGAGRLDGITPKIDMYRTTLGIVMMLRTGL
jgi:hypothetical protein